MYGGVDILICSKTKLKPSIRLHLVIIATRPSKPEAMSTPAYYELYRRSTLGLTLADALDTLILDEKIQPQLAMRILNNFDRIISETLKPEANVAKSKLTFKGDLSTYRFCDDVWTFIIKKVLIKMSDATQTGEDNEINVDKFKIVACNSRKAGEL